MKNRKPVRLAIIFTPITALALLIGCTNPPDYPIEPKIEFLSLTKDTLRRGAGTEDTTFVTFSFTDGDGDIGSDDSLQLNVKDNRISTITPLKIPFVPELGASNGIKGEITARLFTTCCIFPDPLLDPCNDEMASYPYDQVIYDIYITDRAGHQSNTIQVDPIFIQCFD